MQYDEFIGQVQNRAHLASSGEAVSAVRATLETLAQRLAGGAPENLAAQLPQEIGIHLLGPTAGAGERLSLDDFLALVSLQEGVDLPQSVHHARVVLEVLGEAVSPGEMEKVRAQLPEEYNRLFEAGSTGEMTG
ncbi:MAG: DUF2267 domain-containing protein [Armatimonadetes bacterium]|nr:DUF2267 domain-containing protein [Armatimonadota bacterium]